MYKIMIKKDKNLADTAIIKNGEDHLVLSFDITNFSNVPIEIKKMVFDFTGTGFYGANEIANVSLYIDKNCNSVVDQSDTVLKDIFNVFRRNGKVYSDSFMYPLFLSPDTPVQVLVEYNFALPVEDKTYSIKLKPDNNNIVCFAGKKRINVEFPEDQIKEIHGTKLFAQ